MSTATIRLEIRSSTLVLTKSYQFPSLTATWNMAITKDANFQRTRQAIEI